jgi:hypothetical protein
MTKKRDPEDRKQQQFRRLGTQNPRCVCCGESDPAVLELHHIAGRKHSDDLSIVCANCHRKLSNQQRDHVPPGTTEPEGISAKIGRYLLGLADLFALVVKALREFGHLLIEFAMQEGVS